jgi:hypothetical protein
MTTCAARNASQLRRNRGSRSGASGDVVTRARVTPSDARGVPDRRSAGTAERHVEGSRLM